MMNVIIIFEESSFILSFVSYGLVTKSLGAGCTFEEVAEKIKCQKMNKNLFTTRGENPLKLLYSIMILNTISLPYKAGPINLLFLEKVNNGSVVLQELWSA